MFKCNGLVAILLFTTQCVHTSNQQPEFVEVEKACSERKKLVFKLMKFSEKDFVYQKDMGRPFNTYEIMDLKPSLLKREKLQWLQLRFERGHLQELWYGPRQGLQKDLERIGLKASLLRDQKGRELKKMTGQYYVKDVEGRSVRIEHEGAPQKGTTITCYPLKSYKKR